MGLGRRGGLTRRAGGFSTIEHRYEVSYRFSCMHWLVELRTSPSEVSDGEQTVPSQTCSMAGVKNAPLSDFTSTSSIPP